MKKATFTFHRKNYCQHTLQATLDQRITQKLMGLIMSYYVMDESSLEKIKNPNTAVREYIEDEILFSHDYKNLPFWRNRTEFGEDLKSWNPMIELICLMDEEKGSVFRNILSKQNLIPQNDNNENYKLYCISNQMVESIWIKLKEISVGNIENSLKNINLIEKIKNADGYRMNYVAENLIVMEFMELFQCVYTALSRRQGILILIS